MNLAVQDLVEIGLSLALSGGISALIMGRKGRSRWAGWALGLLPGFGILIAAVLPRLPPPGSGPADPSPPGTEPPEAQGVVGRPPMVKAAAVTLIVVGGFWGSAAIIGTVFALVESLSGDEATFALFLVALVMAVLALPNVIAGIRLLRLSNTWRVVGILLLAFFGFQMIGTSVGVAYEWERGESSGVVALAFAILGIASSLWSAWLIFVLVKHRRLFAD